jgi:sugar lactone lactonase YvrE
MKFGYLAINGVLLKNIGLIVLILLLSPFPSNAENLLNNPESVVFDSLRNRYLVSNWGDGAIVQIDSLGQQTYYSTELMNQYSLAGLYVYGDTLLAAAGNAPNPGIAGFDLETAAIVFHITIPGIGLPNDITSDSAGIIYVTDYWEDKLYKITNHTPSVFVSQDLDYPNGMMYDQSRNRLLILSVMGPGAPILAVDLEDSSLSTVVVTGLSGTDGITMDSEGRVYVSEWTGDTTRRYDNDFSLPPELFSTGHDDPADIYYDSVNDLLVVPNFSSHTLDFLQVNPLSINEYEIELPRSTGLLQNYPNPFNPRTVINYSLSECCDVSLGIYNVKGKLVRQLVNEAQGKGTYKVIWNGKNTRGEQVGSGIYFSRLRAGRSAQSRKMLLLK